jgi:filamentous hemagglutinin
MGIGGLLGGTIGGAGGTLAAPGVGTLAGAGEVGAAGAAWGTALGAAAGNAISDMWGNLTGAKANPLNQPQTMCKKGDGDGGGSGNLKNLSNGKMENDGIDAHALKEDFVGPENVSKFNTAVDGDGNVVLTPRIAGNGANVPTGLNYSELSDLYPLGD